jgi:hypothetical protein
MEAHVHIDLKQTDAVTLAAVRALIASGDPTVHNQLRVTRDGIAFLSTQAVGGKDVQGLCFRLETWAAGSGYVGIAAAADEIWVQQIYTALRTHWPAPKSDYIDLY